MAKLITEYHNGADLYSDGAVEDELLELFKSGGDAAARLKNDRRWPVLYHLAPERRNLLEWFPFRRAGNLLEIGAGCGALTGFFAGKVNKVTAVELSLKRSRIICERCRPCANLEIIAGNICDLKFEEKFDYVTLIGVLEYAALFIKTPEPARHLLEIGRRLLKPAGILFLALENKFGLKYFAGAGEEHSGRFFDGIEGYPGGGPALTYSRAELTGLLQSAGCVQQDFYYPYPDYKLPEEIFSDAWLPAAGQVLRNAPNYDLDRYHIFSERKAWLDIIKAGNFPFFSNSFLVLASPG